MKNYMEFAVPTTEENRHDKGAVNVPVEYHNYLLDCALKFRKQEVRISQLEQEAVKLLKPKLRKSWWSAWAT